MDDRVREHAEVLVDWSARIDEGDDVMVSVAEDAHELGVAVAEKLGAVGAKFVGVLGDAHYDVVAVLDARAPLDQHLGVFAYAVVHRRAVRPASIYRRPFETKRGQASRTMAFRVEREPRDKAPSGRR